MNDIHIGAFIHKKLEEKEHSVAWLARKINYDPSNLRKLLKQNHIHSALLFRIADVLDEDFFVYYSQKLTDIKNITSKNR